MGRWKKHTMKTDHFGSGVKALNKAEVGVVAACNPSKWQVQTGSLEQVGWIDWLYW